MGTSLVVLEIFEGHNIQGHGCIKEWSYCQKCIKLQMGMAGPIFELNPSNVVRIHTSPMSKNVAIYVKISKEV